MLQSAATLSHQSSMSVTCVEQEVACVLHWFSTWSPMQKQDFLKALVEKAVPHKVTTLFDAMDGLDMSDRPPSIFKCQMKLFNQWIDGWTDKQRNDFMVHLEVRDHDFVAAFNEQVANTSGQP